MSPPGGSGGTFFNCGLTGLDSDFPMKSKVVQNVEKALATKSQGSVARFGDSGGTYFNSDLTEPDSVFVMKLKVDQNVKKPLTTKSQLRFRGNIFQ